MIHMRLLVLRSECSFPCNPRFLLVFIEIEVCFYLRAEQKIDKEYAQITLHPDADVRNMFYFFSLLIILFHLPLFGCLEEG